MGFVTAKRRVVVTGLGIVSPIGNSVDEAWANLLAGKSGIARIARFDPEDEKLPISCHIAPAKAKTAALGCRESRIYEEMINGGRGSFLSAPVLEGMLEGGVPIMKDGQCIGAVGVSGVKSAEDAQIARAGIAALGL